MKDKICAKHIFLLVMIIFLFFSGGCNYQSVEDDSLVISTPVITPMVKNTPYNGEEIIEFNTYQENYSIGKKVIQVLIDETDSSSINTTEEVSNYRYNLPKFILTLLKNIDKEDNIEIGVAAFSGRNYFDVIIPIKKTSELELETTWYKNLSSRKLTNYGEDYTKSLQRAIDSISIYDNDFEKKIILITDGSILHTSKKIVEPGMSNLVMKNADINFEVVLLKSENSVLDSYWENDIGNRDNVEICIAGSDINDWVPGFVDGLFLEDIDNFFSSETKYSKNSWNSGDHENEIRLPWSAEKAQIVYISFNEEDKPVIKNMNETKIILNQGNIKNEYFSDELNNSLQPCVSDVYNLEPNNGLGYYWVNTTKSPVLKLVIETNELVNSNEANVDVHLEAENEVNQKKYGQCCILYLEPNDDLDVFFVDGNNEQNTSVNDGASSWKIRTKQLNDKPTFEINLSYKLFDLSETFVLPIKHVVTNDYVEHGKVIKYEEVIDGMQYEKYSVIFNFKNLQDNFKIFFESTAKDEEKDDLEREASKTIFKDENATCSFNEALNYEVFPIGTEEYQYGGYSKDGGSIKIQFYDFMYSACKYDKIKIKTNVYDDSGPDYVFEIKDDQLENSPKRKSE